MRTETALIHVIFYSRKVFNRTIKIAKKQSKIKKHFLALGHFLNMSMFFNLICAQLNAIEV